MNSFYPTIPVKLLDPDAPMPKYARDGDAGVDLCATEDVTLRPGEWQMIGEIPNCDTKHLPMGYDERARESLA